MNDKQISDRTDRTLAVGCLVLIGIAVIICLVAYVRIKGY